MRTLIAGSRSFKHKVSKVYDLLDALELMVPGEITEVIEGEADGIDKLAREWAEGFGIPVTPYPADWDGLGRRAGYLRNLDMAKACEQAIVIWDGYSLGTKHMIDILLTSRKPMALMVIPSV